MRPAKYLAYVLLLAAAPVLAQPAMIDPSRMSGIPRPDPQVPAGTITVRLIRGELANRLVGMQVSLADAAGQVVTAKTDDAGRATFGSLKGQGPYVAKASDGTEELSSQPIELPADTGVRVMLVFKPSGGADGVARADKDLPARTVVVRAIGEGDTPLDGLDVVLGHARAGESGVEQLKGKTDAKGEARFTELSAKPTDGYLAEVIKDGTRYAGKPFKLNENQGSRVVIEVRPVSRDLSGLKLVAPGTHLGVEISDDALRVFEALRISNPGTMPIDPGPGGLHLPLPAAALSAEVIGNPSPNLSVAGHDAVWRGPIPPGETDVQVGFLLVYKGDTVEMEQPTPVPFEEIALVTDRIDGFHVEGEHLTSEEGEWHGRKLNVYRGPAPPAGGKLVLRFVGLPHADTTARNLAAAVSIALVLGFLGYSFAGSGGASAARRRLERQREELLSELVELERAAEDGPARRSSKRAELTTKLAKIYRQLDEAGR